MNQLRCFAGSSLGDCPKYMLHVHRNNLKKISKNKSFIIFGIWAKQYQPSGKRFWRVCQNCIPRVHTNFMKKNNFLKKKSFFQLFEIERKSIDLLSEVIQQDCPKHILRVHRNILIFFHGRIVFFIFFGHSINQLRCSAGFFFGGIVQNPCYMSIETVWGKFWTNISFINFGIWAKKYRPSGEKFRYVCRNCIPRVHRNFMRKKKFFEKNYIFKFFWNWAKSINLLSEVFWQDCPKHILHVNSNILKKISWKNRFLSYSDNHLINFDFLLKFFVAA